MPISVVSASSAIGQFTSAASSSPGAPPPSSSAYGLYTQPAYNFPASTVDLYTTSNIQSVINAHPSGTTYRLNPGTYSGTQAYSFKGGDVVAGANGQRDNIIFDMGTWSGVLFPVNSLTATKFYSFTVRNGSPGYLLGGPFDLGYASQNIEVHDVHFLGNNTNGSAIAAGRGSLIDNCYFSKWGNTGLSSTIQYGDGYVESAPHPDPNLIFTVSNCEFTACGMGTSQTSDQKSNGAGIKVTWTNGAKFQNNYFHDNFPQIGCWVDVYGANTVFSGNYAANNYNGFFLEIPNGNATITNNTFVNNGLNAGQAGNFYNANGGLVLSETARGYGTAGAYSCTVSANTFQGNNNDLTIYDGHQIGHVGYISVQKNTFSGAVGYIGCQLQSEEAWPPPGVTFSGNTYPANQLFVWRGSVGLSLSQWSSIWGGNP